MLARTHTQHLKSNAYSFTLALQRPRCYAITMISEEKNLWNGLITPSVTSDGETLFKLFVKQKFSSLPELIEYYYDHPVTKGQSGRMVCLARS